MKNLSREPTLTFSFIHPPLEKNIEVLLRMERHLQEKDIQLFTCCEKAIVENLPVDSHIANSSCVPNDMFAELSGGELQIKLDRGQRIKEGCGCMVSSDIGSYSLHPCYHSCLFCYANPDCKSYKNSFMDNQLRIIKK